VSYSEKDGRVILEISREDYELAMLIIGSAPRLVPFMRKLALLNRLNEGNPHYTPYEVAEKKS
jgi:hypothetical protein